MYKIMVLNDGFTYSDVEGCEILAISDTGHDLFSEGTEIPFLDPKYILYRELIGYELSDSGGRILRDPHMGLNDSL